MLGLGSVEGDRVGLAVEVEQPCAFDVGVAAQAFGAWRDLQEGFAEAVQVHGGLQRFGVAGYGVEVGELDGGGHCLAVHLLDLVNGVSGGDLAEGCSLHG